VVVSFHSSYIFLENNAIYAMLNPLRKKRVRVYSIPNSLLRETPFGLQPLGIHNMIRSLAYCSINLA
jgi:hypothetical protein